MLTALHILGQIILGGFFIYSGFNHFKNHKDYTAYAVHNKVPLASAAVYLTGLLLLLGGLGIFFNIYQGIAILFAAIFLIGVTPMMHAFWKSDNPGERASQKIAFMKNLAILGALLMIFQSWK